MSLQRKCTKFELGPDIVVLEGRAERKMQLRTQSPSSYLPGIPLDGLNHELLYQNQSWNNFKNYIKVPPANNALRLQAAHLTPLYDSAGTQMFSDTPRRSTRGLLMMHERTALHGDARLVVIEVGWVDEILVTVIKPAGMFTRPEVLSHGWAYLDRETYRVLCEALYHVDQASLYAGQVDRTDLSHFTIRLDVSGHEQTLQGWLDSDDTVRIEAPGGFSFARDVSMP